MSWPLVNKYCCSRQYNERRKSGLYIGFCSVDQREGWFTFYGLWEVILRSCTPRYGWSKTSTSSCSRVICFEHWACAKSTRQLQGLPVWRSEFRAAAEMEMEVEGDVGKVRWLKQVGALQTKDGVGRDTDSLKGDGKESVFGTRLIPWALPGFGRSPSQPIRGRWNYWSVIGLC